MDYGVGSELFFTILLRNGRDKAVYKVKVCILQGVIFDFAFVSASQLHCL
jgi:hypothetical protein